MDKVSLKHEYQWYVFKGFLSPFLKFCKLIIIIK